MILSIPHNMIQAAFRDPRTAWQNCWWFYEYQPLMAGESMWRLNWCNGATQTGVQQILLQNFAGNPVVALANSIHEVCFEATHCISARGFLVSKDRFYRRQFNDANIENPSSSDARWQPNFPTISYKDC